MNKLILSLAGLLLASNAFAQLNTFSDGDVISAQKMNENFEHLQQQLLGARTTTVNCDDSETINGAIEQGFNDIMVKGTCKENLRYTVWREDTAENRQPSGKLAPRFLKISGVEGTNATIEDTSANADSLVIVKGGITLFLKDIALSGGEYSVAGQRNANVYLSNVSMIGFGFSAITIADSAFLGIDEQGVEIDGNDRGDNGIVIGTGSSGWVNNLKISGVRRGIYLIGGSMLWFQNEMSIDSSEIGVDIYNSRFMNFQEPNLTIQGPSDFAIRTHQGDIKIDSGSSSINNISSGVAVEIQQSTAIFHNLNIENYSGGTGVINLHSGSNLKLNDSKISITSGSGVEISGNSMAVLDEVSITGGTVNLNVINNSTVEINSSFFSNPSDRSINTRGNAVIDLANSRINGSSNSEAIKLNDGSMLQIRNTTVSEARTGISAAYNSTIRLEGGNTISENERGIQLFDSTLHQYDDVPMDTIGPNTYEEIDARKSFVELNEANILGTAGDSELRLQQMSYLTLGQNANLQGNIDRDSTSIQVTEDGEILGALQRGQTLEGVRKRGLLRCGVSQGLAGFSRQDNLGTWEGLDVDYCRAVAAAIFGDTTKVEYISLTASERFEALRSGEIDVLSRNSTWTMGRDTSLEVEFVGVNYYDGQALMVRSSLGASSALELDGKSACVNTGTSTESNLVDFFAENQLELVSISYNSGEEALAGYLTGDCDIYTTDRSGLAAQRSVFDTPTDHQILPETISKEPLSPVVREDDPQWIELTRWTRHALLTAEELGVNSGNVDSLTNSPQRTIRLLLGTEGDLHEQIGLNSNWAYNVVKQVGNYGEIYERNVGTNSPLMLTRAGSDNALWKDGGLLYAPPIR